MWLLYCPVVLCTLVFAAAEVEDRSSPFPVGDPRNCLPDLRDRGLRIDVLPGRGWDNLRNVDQSSVLAFNYSQCRTTYDGQYLLPNGMTAIPKLQSKVDTYARVFGHALNYTSNTAISVNFDATVYSVISGKFSTEYETFRERFFREKSIMSRVQLRHHRYVIKAHVSSQLDPSFRNRVLQIAASVQNNATDMAAYLSQLLVRDYGTHYIHTTHVGAMLVKEDFLRENAMKNTDRTHFSVSSGAQADFFGKVKLQFGTKSSSSEGLVEKYQSFITSTSVETFGGPLFTTNTSVTDWEAGVESAMVAIDRDGDPIHYIISPDNLPEIQPSVVLTVANHIKEAAEKYYEVNTHRGCTDTSSKNFNFFANIDDNSCTDASSEFPFGGVYQTCSLNEGGKNFCSSLTQNNPLTGSAGCPTGYRAILLQSSKSTRVTYSRRCWNTYKRCGIFWSKRCRSGQACQPTTDKTTVTYKTYWCAPHGQGHPIEEYYFGGTYTNEEPNPFTGRHGCPTSFRALKLTEKGHVCVSADPELGKPHSFPFAGFYSCMNGNPLARRNSSDGFPRECPSGYSQHLAMVDNDCAISYCLKAGILSAIQQMPIQLPPFMNIPESSLNDTYNFYLWATDGSLWMKNASKEEWDKYPEGSTGYNSLLAMGTVDGDGNTQDSSQGEKKILSTLEIALITALTVITAVVTIIMACCLGQRCISWYKGRKAKEFAHLDRNSSSAVAMSMSDVDPPVARKYHRILSTQSDPEV